jgi:hypothetical protein
MRKILTLAAAVASAFAMGAAQADVILIDDFNGPATQQIAFDPASGGGAGTSTVQAIVGNPLPLLAINRQLSNELLSAAVNNSSANLSSIAAGPSPNFPAFALNVANANFVDSVNKVIWTIGTPPADALLGPVSLFLDVLASNVGVPGNPNTISFDLNGTPISAVASIGNVGNTPLTFALSAADIALFAAPGNKTLTMTINGEEGYDLTLDSFGLSVPEPTSLALVGLALFGAGVAARRRKA